MLLHILNTTAMLLHILNAFGYSDFVVYIGRRHWITDGKMQRMSDRKVKSGEGMLEVLSHDLNRYDYLSEHALANIMDTDLEEELIKISDNEMVENKENVDVCGEHEGDDPVCENSRFPSVSLEDTDAFIQQNINKNTHYKTKSDLKIFKDWATSIGEFRDIKDIPPVELDCVLARFFLGVRKKDGSEYEPDSLSSIQNSIDRYLRDEKVTSFNIKKDVTFTHSRRVLESKRKSLKAMGKGNKVNKAEALTDSEITILHKKNILGAANPNSLLNTVWMNNVVYLGLRGRQDHTNLLWGDITLKKTSDGKEFLEFNERSTKTRSGGKPGDYRRVQPKMFERKGDSNCPVTIYKAYASHRPDDLQSAGSRFYLRPLINPIGKVWYSHQPLGKEKLGKMMNSMAENRELTGRKVNHSTRKTFATTLVQKGVPPTEVAALGGWKNVQTINEYSVPSIQQQQAASSVLSTVMIPVGSDMENQTDHAHSVAECEKSLNTVVDTIECVYSASTTETKSNVNDGPLSVLCGAHISGGTININITPYAGSKLQEQ